MLRKTTFISIAILALTLASAGEKEALEAFEKAREKEQAGKILTAADYYNEAQVQADDPAMKANALTEMARCYQTAKKYGAEFDCLQNLIEGHASRINFSKTVKRQYEIANEYFKGYRDYYVSWLPFLKLDDRTIEMYKAVLKSAPYAPEAAEARLRLGRLYIEEQKPKEAMDEFTSIIKLYPNSSEAKYAALELANVLMQLSERGDGDGKYAKEAIASFDNFIKRYPNAPEIAWIKTARETVRAYIAKRYRNLGEFYVKQGKNDIAKRYLATVVQEYPDTPDTPPAERLLSKLDKEYQSNGYKWTQKERDFKIMSLPREDAPVTVIPSESEGRWLLPVRDYKSSIIEKDLDNQ